MAEGNFLNKAIQVVTQATDEDRAGNFHEAFRLYTLSLDYFVTALKWEKNERCRATIKQKMGEYLARAEQLKEYIDKKTRTAMTSGGGAVPDTSNVKNNNNNNNNNNNANGGGDKKDGDGDKDADDPETARLLKGIESQILVEKPKVTWSDVAGLHQAKEALKEAVIMPIKFPHMFNANTVREPWKAVLLYGPPGTGKSFLAKALANQAASTFISISATDLVSKWLGESEKLVRGLFEVARRRRPSIVFIDEVDSVCGSRSDQESESARRIKTQFLIEMNGVGRDVDNVLILGATNMPWALDAGIRRRFERRIYIPLPDVGARFRLFQLSLRGLNTSLTKDDIRQLAEQSEGMSGHDVNIVVRDAAMAPIRTVQCATHFKRVVGPPRELGPPQQQQPSSSSSSDTIATAAPSASSPSDSGNAPNAAAAAAAPAATATATATAATTLPSSTTSVGGNAASVQYWTPCSPGDAEAVEMTWEEIDGPQLLEPPVHFSDFVKALRRNRASVSAADVERHIEFTETFGQDG